MNEDDKEDLISFINKYDNIFIQPNLIKKFNEIVTYLQNQSNFENKILIIDFLLKLNSPIFFNIDIIYNICKDLNVNLYKLLIDEFFLSNNQNYCKKIITLLLKLINSKNCVYEIYEYYQQFILKHIHNNNNDTNEKITSEYLNKYLELGKIFFTFHEPIEPYNYLYFSDFYNISELLIINNKLLNFKEGLNILLFFNLIIKPNEIKKYNKNFKEFILIEILLNSNEKISLSINENSELIASFYKDSLFFPFALNEYINLLLKFKEINNKIIIDLYINENKINFNQTEINYSEFVQINLFKNFIGTVSNIILYKNDINNNIEEGIPSIFYDNKNKILIPFGIYNDYLFFNFINEDLINEKNKFIFKDNIQFFNEEKDSKKIFNFYKNLIAIYLPNRMRKNKNDFILFDSINNINALFKVDEKVNGIYLSEFNSNNLNIFGGFNIFIPIFEYIIKCEDILIDQIFQNFFQIIIENLEINNDSNLYNLINENFLFVFSLFLEKIPNKFNNNFLVSLINIISNKIKVLKDSYGEKNEKINLLNNEFNNIILNSNIFFNYDINNQQIIIKQFLKNNEKNIDYFFIDENQIIKILLNYDKEKNYKFCCKKHANYYNSTSIEILEPELNDRLNYLNKLFDYYRKIKKTEIFSNIFNLLSKDLSPCLQLFIIDNFIIFLKNFDNFLDNIIKIKDLIEICFFVLKTGLFDVKIKIIELIFKIFTLFNLFSDYSLTIEGKNFIFNNILPKHFIFNLFDFKNNNNNSMIYNNIKYNIISFSEKEISIYKNYKENNYFYEIIDNLINLLIIEINSQEIFYFFLDCIVKIISFMDLNHIYKFFTEQIKKLDVKILNFLNNNLYYFHFFLDSCFLAFINIENNENKFPLKNFEEIKEDERNKIIKTIYDQSFGYILFFIKNNVYLLDFLMTWTKYYFVIFENNNINNNKLLYKFINTIFTTIISDLKFNINNNPNELQKYFYINNIYFEYLYYLKFEQEKESDNNIIINQIIYKFSLKIKNNFELNFSETEEEKNEIELINNFSKIIKYTDFIDNLLGKRENLELYKTKQKKILTNYISYFFHEFNDNNLITVNKGINLFIITLFNINSILNIIKDYEKINKLLEKIINFMLFLFFLSLI